MKEKGLNWTCIPGLTDSRTSADTDQQTRSFITLAREHERLRAPGTAIRQTFSCCQLETRRRTRIRMKKKKGDLPALELTRRSQETGLGSSGKDPYPPTSSNTDTLSMLGLITLRNISRYSRVERPDGVLSPFLLTLNLAVTTRDAHT